MLPNVGDLVKINASPWANMLGVVVGLESPAVQYRTSLTADDYVFRIKIINEFLNTQYPTQVYLWISEFDVVLNNFGMFMGGMSEINEKKVNQED